MRKYLHSGLMIVGFLFGQAANYANPDVPLWGKLTITGGTMSLIGWFMCLNTPRTY